MIFYRKPAVVVPKQEKTIQEPPPAEDTSVGKKSGSPFTHVTSTPLPADRVQAAAEPKVLISTYLRMSKVMKGNVRLTFV